MAAVPDKASAASLGTTASAVKCHLYGGPLACTVRIKTNIQKPEFLQVKSNFTSLTLKKNKVLLF